MDVSKLRSLLMEIGQQQYNTVTDEERIVDSESKVYPLFPNIHSVIGVWAIDDYSKTTNLYAGHDKVSIEVTGANPGDRVLVSYITTEGLSDEVAATIIDWARVEVLADLGDFTLNIDSPTTNLERAANVYWGLLCLVNAYLLMNNVNFIQSDANMSLFNYQTMSKLWGEGMSTDALFMRLFQRIEQVRKAMMYLTIDDDFIDPGYSEGYWTDDEMIEDWIGDLTA